MRVKALYSFILLIFITLVITGCVTAYQPEGSTGGYTQEPAADGLTKISFSGNGFASEGLVKRYLLLRCAQLGKEKNMPYFALYTSISDAATNKKSSEPATYQMFNQQTAYAYVKYHLKKSLGDLDVEQVYTRYEKFLNMQF